MSAADGVLREIEPEQIRPVIASALARMRPPAYGDARLSWQRIELSELRSIVHLVRRQRLESACELLGRFQDAGLGPYAPVRTAANGETSLVIPPVAESHGADLVLLDGVHRCLAALACGLRSIEVFVVRGDLPGPPGDVCALAEIGLTSAHPEPERTYRNLRNEDFRRVRDGGGLEAVVRQEIARLTREQP
ncbi:hypothetical protein [Actinomadura rubrisoli]|uniref:hypothetical protein n=1 Tax=Actinomadura rubrisoli TaxID=2530368 RepID=UPI001404C397|nr:hypothetical protein [Actinomadura rubrisoli]